jgi:methylase of polypeptide subunit release factors
MTTNFDIAAGMAFLREAMQMVGKQSESPIRHVLSARLPAMFPASDDQPRPWWVDYHAKGSETHIRSDQDGKTKRGFIDTLVGSTAIEYEKDISDPALALHGEDQVREYCAGLLNRGIPAELIIGVLSDTIRWRAYRIKEVRQLVDLPGSKSYGQAHVVLEEIERIDLSAAGTLESASLGRFLTLYLGRLASRVLGADTLASDLGFDSKFCSGHLEGIAELVEVAFVDNASYAKLIEKVWTDFVSYLGGSGTGGGFDRETYVHELYILTLAKLLCANVLERKALISSDNELESILNGTFFKLKGFSNLVEYDYFGWLNENAHVKRLLPVARGIQEDLGAYNFLAPPAEDLFGALMVQLARRSQRLLLGQEWTPSWLAHHVVENTIQRIPLSEDPHLVDMCCGSGSMIVEAIKQTRMRIATAGNVSSTESLERLSKAITGFDIDPLAVMLAKVTWILAARDLIDVAEVFDVAIPIYHADSLFASTPVTKSIDQDGSEKHELDLDGNKVSLPCFLVSPRSAALFNTILTSSYDVAMEAAKGQAGIHSKDLPQRIVFEACKKSQTALNEDETVRVNAFVTELLVALESLQRDGRNGIWAFVLSNSYRPGLVSGSFNGLVANPPWLAMSKIADNPYKHSLLRMTEEYGIKPSGSSHLHAELATIFLIHAIDRYLAPGAVIGCILPESVLSAHHHNRFRRAEYVLARKPVPFRPDAIWPVESGTFKNEAVVLFGQKVDPDVEIVAPKVFTGNSLAPTGLTPVTIYVGQQGDRTAWSDRPISSTGTGFFDPAPFRQGADVFPRTAVFQEVTPRGNRFDLSPIVRPDGPSAYLVNEAKKFKDFSITAQGVDGQFVFDILLSNHLTPFAIHPPAKGLLPIERGAAGWLPASTVSIATAGPSTVKAFEAFFQVVGHDSEGYFALIDTPRRKLAIQVFPSTGWLVVMGAGGKLVCAACSDISQILKDRLVIDQTLYWVVVQTQDEALYLTGLLNSEAINLVIEQFQPRGQFGERHVHTLPLGVTPPFNPLDPAHVDVVSNTQTLIAQWKADQANHSSAFTDLLDPNQRLSNRRTALRKRLKMLPGYGEYEAACRSLYAV